MLVPYMVYCVSTAIFQELREADVTLDLMLATIPNVFQDIYHFETQYTGLAYLGRKSGIRYAQFASNLS